MDHEEAANRIREIHRIVERTTMHPLLPGTSAVIGGLAALAGCVASYAVLPSVDFARVVSSPRGVQAAFFALWAAVGACGIVLNVLVTKRQCRKLGIHPLPRPARFAGLSMAPAVLVALVFTVSLLAGLSEVAGSERALRQLAPLWMMCYGAGLYGAGLFSVRLPRLLGIAFLAAGAAGMLFFDRYALVLVAFSFGLFHIVFGLVVMRSLAGRNRS